MKLVTNGKTQKEKMKGVTDWIDKAIMENVFNKKNSKLI